MNTASKIEAYDFVLLGLTTAECEAFDILVQQHGTGIVRAYGDAPGVEEPLQALVGDGLDQATAERLLNELRTK